MNAADLIAGARALIEPLTGYTPPPWAVRYPVESHPDFACIEPAAGYLEGDHYLSVSGNCSAATAATLAASPVMRDTIEALLDDRDALTQRIEALEAALRFYIDPDNWLIGGPLDGDSPNYTGGPGRDALQADEAAQ